MVRWRDYILAQIAPLTLDCSQEAAEQFDVGYALYAFLACGDEFLNALYAKRHLLTYLIARYASKVDYYTSFTRDIGRYLRESKSESQDFSTSTSQSSRRADTVALSREDSTSESRSALFSQDYTTARSASEQRTTADDTGFGETVARSEGRSEEQSRSQEDGSSRSASGAAASSAESSCAMHTSYDVARANLSLASINTSLSGGSEHLEGRSFTNRSDADESSSRVDFQARASETSEDFATSQSYFNDNSDSISNSNSASASASAGFTDSDTTQRDRGQGFGISESRSTTQNSGITYGRGESESEMDSIGVSVSRHEVNAQDLSDIAQHLAMMYELNEQDIASYIAARNKMKFLASYLQRYADPLICVGRVFEPRVLKHDVLNTRYEVAFA